MGGATCRKTPISQYTLEKNPMTRNLFEDNPVDEGTTKGALTPLCIVWKNVCGTYSSTRGLSPREQLEMQADFHSSTQDES